MLSVDDVCEILSVELLGIVPDDEEIIDTTNRGEPSCSTRTAALRAIYDKIARRLEGELVPFTSFDRPRILRASDRRHESGVACTICSPHERDDTRGASSRRAAGTRDRRHVGQRRRRQDDDDRQPRHGARAARRARRAGRCRRRTAQSRHRARPREPRQASPARRARRQCDARRRARHRTSTRRRCVCWPPRRRAKKTTSTPRRCARSSHRLRERFDYVLIDCPAGIELGFKNAVAGADEAIVVCTPEVSAVRDVDRVVGLLGNRVQAATRDQPPASAPRQERARCFRSRTSTRFCACRCSA